MNCIKPPSNPKPIDWEPMPFNALTKVKGPVNRHLEALWADIKSLKYEIEILKEQVRSKHGDE